MTDPASARLNKSAEERIRKPAASRTAKAALRGTVLRPHFEPSPREERRNAKMFELIASALKVLSRDGYGQFSMRSVAEDAGISLGNLQHYFKTKDNLIFEAGRIYFSKFLDQYSNFQMQENMTAAEKIDCILQDIIEVVSKKETAQIFFEFWAIGRRDPAVASLGAANYEKYCNIFSELFLATNPKLSRKEAADLGFLLAAQSEGLVVLTAQRTIQDRLSDSMAQRFKSMWLALAGVDLPEQPQTTDGTRGRS